MPKEELSDRLKKNLLDLQFNKYLQYYTTAIIILFTYLIGITIAFVTKQVDYKSINQVMLVGIISISVISIVAILMLRFKSHMSNIIKEVKKLKEV
ncbi:MAG: hypothetical protein Q7J54_06620 [Candidatus Woesearchaeota archaeon]|nr:hypothetical protein [Candidatus Woesearchaeota archaeon]